jgi:hypothetical protein
VILVYALTAPAAPVPKPLRRVTVGAVTAVVQIVRRPPKPTLRALRAFDRRLASLDRSVPAILPVRFGTGIADLAELTLILQARQQALRRSLRSVRGRVQMTVRIVNVEAPTPKSQPARSGSEYLRQRAAARDVPGFAPLRAAVRRWVKDERVEKRERIASVYHLVPRGSVPAYRRALEAAASDAGLRVVVSGPWPPYAFATTF